MVDLCERHHFISREFHSEKRETRTVPQALIEHLAAYRGYSLAHFEASTPGIRGIVRTPALHIESKQLFRRGLIKRLPQCIADHVLDSPPPYCFDGVEQLLIGSRPLGPAFLPRRARALLIGLENS